MAGLHLGTATINITPSHPVQLSGFASRWGRGSFQGIAHPLYARVLLFEQPDGPGPKRRALFVAADLLWWAPERIAGIVAQLQERWAVAPEAIILHATHTHSGPQTSRRFAPSIGEADPRYVASLEARLFQAVEAAAQRIEPVVVELGRGVCGIGIHRRKLVDGQLQPAPDPDGPVDPEVSVIRFRTPNGRAKAILVHYTCHPVITDGMLVSSEFPGVAMAQVEQAVGEGVVAAYLQGCCGDVRPRVIHDGQFARGDVAVVHQVGALLAQEVLRVLRQPLQPLAPVPLNARTAQVALAFQRLPLISELEAQRDQPGIVGEWSRLLLANPERLQRSIPLTLVALELAAGLTLLAMNAEPAVAYGLFAKAYSGGRVLPLGYSNGMIGYVMTAQQIIEGGYDPEGSCPYFGLPGPFAPSVEAQVLAAMIGLM